MRKKYSLILPMINISAKYKNKLPIEFQYDNETGKMNCIKSIENINTELITDIYFVILEVHEKKYNLSERIVTAIKNSKMKGITCKFLYLAYPTSSQAETIYKVIKHYNIEGQIFIKDADNMCICDDPVIGNNVLVYQLENTPLVDPQHKSYISIDDQNFVTNIIEKKVISNLFNCGGYSFEDSQDFIDGYEAVLEFEDIAAHMYISHIIYWLILNKNIKFRPIEAVGYEDFEIK